MSEMRRSRGAAGVPECGFLESAGAALRILSEYLEPLSHLGRYKMRDTIVFFGSARLREDGRWGSTTTTRASWRGC